jgi:hypothetical protein
MMRSNQEVLQLRRRLLPLLLFPLMLVPVSTHAQSELERFSRRLEQIQRDTFIRVNQAIPPGQRAYFDYGGYFSFGYIFLQDQREDTHVLRQYDVTGFARLNLDNVHEFYVRGSAGYRDFNDADSFDGRGDETIDPDFDRAFYKLDLARSAQIAHGRASNQICTLQIGRDLAYWGNGLVLSVPLDGAMFRIGSDRLEAEFLGGVTPVRTVDFDPSRPNFDHHTRRGFFGAMLRSRVGEHRLFAYALSQRDMNGDDDLSRAPDPTKDFRVAYEYNSYYVGAGSSGSLADRWLYGVEAVFEGGSGLSNKIIIAHFPDISTSPQSKETIQAWAVDARLDFLAGDARNTRIGAELVLASGDPDRTLSTSTIGGNRPGTVDHAFNSFGLLNTGLAFAPAVSNLAMVRVGISTFPFSDSSMADRLQVGTEFFTYAKMRSGGGIDQPTDSRRYLGVEPDLFLNWQVSHDVTFSLRYGVFFPSDDNFPDSSARQFFLAGVTYAF